MRVPCAMTTGTQAACLTRGWFRWAAILPSTSSTTLGNGRRKDGGLVVVFVKSNNITAANQTRG